jgi:hypothetical protein
MTYPEKYWHCSVTIDTGQKKPQSSVVNDLSFGQVEVQIIRPWHEGKPFTISGLVVSDKTRVQSIRLVQTQAPKEQYSQEHYARMRAAGIADMATDPRYLPFSKGNDYTHELLFSLAEAPPPDADVSLILRLCQRLPYAAKIIGNRSRKGKTQYIIADEYDVQDLLHSIIRCYLKYSVQEEPLGKVAAAASSRADIAIQELGTIIELKYVHGPSDQVRLLEDFAKDLVLYTQWPYLKTFIYLIYNSADLREPEAFEKLTGRKEINGKVFMSQIVLA